MNLNDNPTLDDLKDIFASCDDDAGHHVLWVDKNGEVNLSVIPKDLTPIGFEEKTTQMQIRYETFIQGNEYVGKRAAEDQSFMKRIFDSMLKNWTSREENHNVVYVDKF